MFATGATMDEQVRRVVLGEDADGDVAVWFDGPSPHVHGVPGYPPELALVDLWYTDPTPTAPGVDAAAREVAIAPEPGGTLFRVVRFPPDGALPKDEDGNPALFWHETATTDFNVVLAGRLALLYDGGEVVLDAGDTTVVHGGKHAWSNRGTELAVLATVGVADRASDA
jgi:mannose-6-phosphate isomerase-like protein (cupin superfamily)